MKTKELILVAAMMGLLLATAFAHDENEITDQRAEFRKERHAYYMENIKPKVDAQRTVLEESISTNDKIEIARLREEIIKQKLIENEFMFEARALRIKGEAIDDGLESELQAQHIVIENLLDQAKVLANNYRPQIDDLLATVKTDINENKSEMNAPQRDFNRGQNNQFRKGPMDRDLFGPMDREFGLNQHHEFGIVAFLLWDVNRG
jgi:hypothetical protein